MFLASLVVVSPGNSFLYKRDVNQQNAQIHLSIPSCVMDKRDVVIIILKMLFPVEGFIFEGFQDFVGF